MNGLENVVIKDFGDAVEYDCVDSDEMKLTYESKRIKDFIWLDKLMVPLDMKKRHRKRLLAGINAQGVQEI